MRNESMVETKRKYAKDYDGCMWGVFLILNILTPYMADDYSLMLAENIMDVFARGYSHYFTTNGRVPAHLFAMLFLLYDKWIFNIANTLIYLFFTALILYHATKGLKLSIQQKIICYLLIHLLLFLYVPNWGQVFLWLDGACNYLWTGTIMLMYLGPVRMLCEGEHPDYKSFFPFGMFITGVIAGWCNENTSGGVILLSCFLIIYLKKKKDIIPIWMYSGLAGTIIGFAVMILAPGNAVRRRIVGTDQRAWYNQLITQIRSLTNCYYNSFRYMIYFLVVTVVFMIVLHVGKKKLAVVFGFIITSLAVCYALALTPVTGGRTFFGCSMFLTIALIYSVATVLEGRQDTQLLIYSYFGILLVAFAVNFCNGFIDIAYYKVHADRREKYVIEQKNSGLTNLIVNELAPKPETKYNAAYGLTDLVNDPKNWPSNVYALHHGVKTVTAVSNDIFERVFRNGDTQLTNCRDIYEYLALIDNPKYTVMIAVNDDSSGAVDEQIVDLMSNLGLQTDLREHFRWSYIAVISQGEVINEQYANQVLNYSQSSLLGHSIEIGSSGKINNTGNFASIKIDGYDYARNSIGLNIVVFDNSLSRVVDRVAFNTWSGLEAGR